MSDDEENPAAVLDIGSAMVRAGFAGDVAPRSIFPSLIGRPSFTPAVMPTHCDLYIGDEVLAAKASLSITHPTEHGIVTNWDDMEILLNYIFNKELRVSPSDQAVLMTEPPLNPKSNATTMTQVMFEKYDVPKFYISNPGILSSLASGRGTGLMVDCGEGLAHVIPIYQGFTIPHSIRRQNLAGRDVTHNLQKLILKRGHTLTTDSEFEIVRDIKEQCCHVALDYEQEINDPYLPINNKNYELPDGTKLTLDSENIAGPEILFQPELYGREEKGLHKLVYETLMDCDIDMRRDFYCNIIISGGTTMLPGFTERLQKELQKLIPSRMICKVVSNPERKHSVWIGGSLLASLSTFSEKWITKEEYWECGPDIIHRRTFL
ncbi:hypothetical protein LOTGIDRAFT_229705 [Lottia gigantea]|uniref:Actin, cytoplasmic n=1 Tax=Lottia gigantea TaxID=225164 RepID=V3Z137_LOTGI|nr:hypothetical protein LOTGIDRAFT_229705 [Lottia gigantea]ESO84253.1 hypothetical protein LOTGIDRAFT_229705 [Lottia gigantea]